MIDRNTSAYEGIKGRAPHCPFYPRHIGISTMLQPINPIIPDRSGLRSLSSLIQTYLATPVTTPEPSFGHRSHIEPHILL